MTRLRKQMIDAMLLRGFAARTQESYCGAVIALAKHYHRPPDTLSAEQLQSYLLFLITKKKLAYASVNQAVCAFRFLFGTVLRRPEVRFDIPMAKVPKRLPQILSREEVRRLIDAAATLRGRTLLTATYAAGLRECPRSHVPQGTPRQGRPGSLHAALAAPARHAAPLLARLSAAPVAVPQPVGQRADRTQNGATHLLRRARRRRHRA
jgi:hypothetical protein